MFALEVQFKDGTSSPTTIYVRRPMAIIGASSFANVILEDMKNLNFQIRLVRNIGRSFSTSLLPLSEGKDLNHSFNTSTLEGTFENQKVLDLGQVKVEIIALDPDFILKENEAPDRAGVRAFRLATSSPSAKFPALLTGSPPMAVSFNSESPLLIGRARGCGMRIESADVSARHARVGFDGLNFWIEDLGSTNGTFVRGARVAARTKVSPGERMMIARDCIVVGVSNDQELSKLLGVEHVPEVIETKISTQNSFPALISLSEVAKPSRLVLAPGFSTKVGREPSSDMWLGAPHISRHHCTVFLADDGVVKIIDQSTNGTEYDSGKLSQGETLISSNQPRVLNFGAGVTVALCFTEDQEKQFRKSKGAVASFGSNAEKSISEEFTGSDDVKISDVSKLIGRRERKATAHHIKAMYGSAGKSERILFWLAALAIFIVLGLAIGLLGAILF